MDMEDWRMRGVWIEYRVVVDDDRGKHCETLLTLLTLAGAVTVVTAPGSFAS